MVLPRKKVLEKGMKDLTMQAKAREIAKRQARLRVDAFIKVQQYSSLVNSGVEPQEAAQRAGIPLPVSKDTKPTDLLRELEENILQRLSKQG